MPVATIGTTRVQLMGGNGKRMSFALVNNNTAGKIFIRIIIPELDGYKANVSTTDSDYVIGPGASLSMELYLHGLSIRGPIEVVSDTAAMTLVYGETI